MGAGNPYAGCAGKTGEDAVLCVWTSDDAITGGLGGDLAPSVARVKGNMAQFMPPPSIDAYYKQQVDCNSGNMDPEIPLVCITPDVAADTWDQGGLAYSVDPATWGQKITGHMVIDNQFNVTAPIFNGEQQNFYWMTKARLESACGDLADTVWPSFYWYNLPGSVGSQQLTDLFKQHPDIPPQCQDLLKSNFTPAVQAKFGLINAPDLSSVTSEWRSGAGFLPKSWGGLDYSDPGLQEFWTSTPFGPDNFEHRLWGNALWDIGQRRQMLYEILGKDPADGKSWMEEWTQKYVDQGFVGPGESAGQYLDPERHAGRPQLSTDPSYSGNMPGKAEYSVGNEPWHKMTKDPDGYGYGQSHCTESKVIGGTLSKALAATVLGGLGAAFIPGRKAKALAAVSGGVAGWYFVQSHSGWDSLSQLANDNDTYSNVVGIAIGTGGSMAITTSAFEIGLVPANLQKYFYPAVGAAGLLGYVFVAPLFNARANVVSTLVNGITDIGVGLVNGTVNLAENLFNGCTGQHFVFHYTCFCQDANLKKPLIDALVRDVYGATGAQADLRTQCLEAAMTTDLWGTDSERIGTCDANGHVTNVAACVSAGEWAYEQWPKEIDSVARPMWQACRHCLDPANPSMLPPKTSQDQSCADKYGKYFRYDPDSGGCLDQRAPVGQQGPNQYVWQVDQKSTSNECTIL